MKAIGIAQFGGPEVFAAMALPTPHPAAGQVLVQVAGSSVNPLDLRIRSGQVPALAPALPAVLHGDVAGRIAALGDGVAGWQVGDLVYACAGGVKGQGGALAEFMVADAALVARAPAGLDPVAAAALPLAAITAWEAIVDRAAVRPGQRVLVHGGTGGVGHLGLQLARLAGGIVTASVAGEAKAALARELGADAVVDYRHEAVADYVATHTGGEGFDVVFDTAGGENLAKSFQAAKPGGCVVTIAARTTADLSPLHAKGLSLHVVFMLLPLLTGRGRAHHGEILARLARLIEGGRLRPLFDPEVFAFRDVAAAHRKLQEGRVVGKLRLAAGF